MDKYNNLDIYNRKYPQKDIENEYLKRKEAYGTLNTKLKIRTVNKREYAQTFELFCVNIPQIISLKNQIYQHSKEINQLVQTLPQIVSDKFINKLMINEIQSTNEVEGVKSTRKEINEALLTLEHEEQNVRFLSTVKQYVLIKHEDFIQIDTPNDIRNLYDKLVLDEIDPSDLPDGDLFRDGAVRIGDEVHTVHTPKSTEKDILNDLYQFIDFQNKFIDYDPLVVVSIMHYYFEYIHPFYDGNGRLGRYIFCSQISQYIDKYTALSFSYMVNQNKKDYYREFANVTKARNYGEMTLFVEMMLSYLEQGQQSVLEYLKESINYVNYVEKLLREGPFTEIQRQLLFLLFIIYKFDDDSEGIEKNDLIDFYLSNHKVSANQIKREIDALEEQGYIIKRKKRPIKYVLSDQILNDYHL